MKKSVKVRMICLIVAAVVLGGAVTAAAFMGSPYETMKTALLDAATYRNVTIESRISMSVNGVWTEKSRSYGIQGDDSSLSYYYDESGNASGFNYSSGSLYIYPSVLDAKSGTQWYYAQVNPRNDYNVSRVNGLAMFSPEDRTSAQMRFIELLADVLIGDLKNNITMTSENGIRHISGTLTGSQVPELVKAGIDVLIEQSGDYYNGNQRDVSFDGETYIFEQINIERGIKTVRLWKQTVEAMNEEDRIAWEYGTYYSTSREYNDWGVTYIGILPYIRTGPQEIIDEYTVPASRADYGNSNDPMDMPMKSFVIDYIRGEAEVDADGNLLYLNANGAATVTNIFDDVSVIEVNAVISFSDIGTSNPTCPVPGAARLFTGDFMNDKFGIGNIGAYFKLNDDGSIDEDSITTTNPWELMNKYYAN